MFSEVCCELEASVVSVMAEALILKLLGRACRVNTASSSQQGVGAMAGTFAVTPLCKLHGHSVCVLSRVLAMPCRQQPPGSSVGGIILTKILEWVAISSSRGSF